MNRVRKAEHAYTAAWELEDALSALARGEIESAVESIGAALSYVNEAASELALLEQIRRERGPVDPGDTDAWLVRRALAALWRGGVETATAEEYGETCVRSWRAAVDARTMARSSRAVMLALAARAVRSMRAAHEVPDDA